MVFLKLHYFPISLLILLPITIITTYIIAVLLEHVEPDFPYISDTGTHSPESCIFSQAFNIGAMLFGCTIYIRYRQIREFFLEQPLGCQLDRPNRLSLIFGLVSCSGLSILANFQETNVFYVHCLGAILCFGAGATYLWLQSIISFRALPVLNSLAVARIRMAFSIICSGLFVVSTITGAVSRYQFHGKDPSKWYPKDGGWELHVASTVSEWIMSLTFFFFVITFVREFRSLQMEPPKFGVRVIATSYSVVEEAC